MATVQIMEKYKGTPSGGHMAIGNVYVYRRNENYTENHGSSCLGGINLCASDTGIAESPDIGKAYDAHTQRARLLAAIERAEHMLDNLIISVASRDKSAADILSVHKIMLRDEELIATVTNLIDNEGLGAGEALSRAEDIACRMISAEPSDDTDTFAGNTADCGINDSPADRSSDVREVLSHIRAALNMCEADFDKNKSEDASRAGEEASYKNDGALPDIKEQSIIVARDMLLSELVKLDRDKILALVTVNGNINSHVSIVARSMGIPVITGCDMTLDDVCKTYNPANRQEAANAFAAGGGVTANAVKGHVKTGMPAIADGQSGEFIVNPDDETLATAQSKISEYNREIAALAALKGLESITKSGRRISVCANINSLDDIQSAIENDADGVGLFRSEGLYIGRTTLPTEDELTESYIKLLTAMKDKNVTVRTLDVAPDKLPECISAASLASPDIFTTQLRAIYRASALCRDSGGRLSVMYPLIRTTDEVREIFNIIKGVESELSAESVKPAPIRHGIMIETPEAVAAIDELASLVDFVSIGTNDLTRSLEDADINSILIKIIADISAAAKRHSIPVYVCGEMASDASATAALINAGVDELSVRPTEILNIRRLIRELN